MRKCQKTGDAEIGRKADPTLLARAKLMLAIRRLAWRSIGEDGRPPNAIPYTLYFKPHIVCRVPHT